MVFPLIGSYHEYFRTCLTSPPLAGGLQPGCKTSPLASFVLQESGLGSDPWLLQPMDPGMDNI